MAEGLKEGQRVLIANTVMEFYYWLLDVPVFTYTIEGIQLLYINHNFNRDTKFQVL